MARTIDVVSLYPKDMNIYGDSGNVLTIRRRLELYGYEPVVHQYNQGDDWPDQVDLILGGGGQDTGQKKIIDDFYHRADLLRSLAADGTPMLMICACTSCSASTLKPWTAPVWTASALSVLIPWARTCV